MSEGGTAAQHRAPPAPACCLVIFGVTGDLAHRLLVPALYNLARWDLLGTPFVIIGVGRSQLDAAALRKGLSEAMQGFASGKGGEFSANGIDEEAWARVVERLDYVQGDLSDDATYAAIGEKIEASGTANAIFYLAVAADLFGPAVEALGRAGLTQETNDAFRRVVIEKPFGHDLESARALNERILAVLREDQIYRMDHFLGKETVQNILAFRFGNGFFEPVWNRDRIDHVQITVSETVGVEKRGRFYEGTGALRDMVPNHLFQLLTLIAMEPPVSFGPDAVRDRKEDVLKAVRTVDGSVDAVRAQYGAGTIGDKSVRDYRHEPDVDPGSATETYAALKLCIDNWRWAGVPFYLRTGKSMARRNTEIAIQFKRAPLALFRDDAHCMDEQVPNWLILHIQPDEGITLQLGAKVPGPKLTLDCVTMGFSYKDWFAIDDATGYETLIYDAMTGDPTLFQRADNIEGGWAVVQPILDNWAGNKVPLSRYPAGSDGPREADELLARDGRAWRALS